MVIKFQEYCLSFSVFEFTVKGYLDILFAFGFITFAYFCLTYFLIWVLFVRLSYHSIILCLFGCLFLSSCFLCINCYRTVHILKGPVPSKHEKPDRTSLLLQTMN